LLLWSELGHQSLRVDDEFSCKTYWIKAYVSNISFFHIKLSILDHHGFLNPFQESKLPPDPHDTYIKNFNDLTESVI
jgi:hypothetical protein